MSKTNVDLNKMSGLLASKGAPVQPASDALQRGHTFLEHQKMGTAKDAIVNLSFKVPAGFRKRFKMAAVEAGITQNELVQQAFSTWEERVETT